MIIGRRELYCYMPCSNGSFAKVISFIFSHYFYIFHYKFSYRWLYYVVTFNSWVLEAAAIGSMYGFLKRIRSI